MEDFNLHKGRVPKPIVIHDKPDPFKNDIQINSLQLVIGGKHLLEDA